MTGERAAGRGPGRQRDQGRPGHRAVRRPVAGRAELADREGGDHRPGRHERDAPGQVAVVELDDRSAHHQAVLVPVPVGRAAGRARRGHHRGGLAQAAGATAGTAAGHGDERAGVAGRGLDHHRVVHEAADAREARGRPGRAEIGVGEEPGELRGVQPDGRDPVAAGPVGAAGAVRVGRPTPRPARRGRGPARPAPPAGGARPARPPGGGATPGTSGRARGTTRRRARRPGRRVPGPSPGDAPPTTCGPATCGPTDGATPRASRRLWCGMPAPSG